MEGLRQALPTKITRNLTSLLTLNQERHPSPGSADLTLPFFRHELNRYCLGSHILCVL